MNLYNEILKRFINGYKSNIYGLKLARTTPIRGLASRDTEMIHVCITNCVYNDNEDLQFFTHLLIRLIVLKKIFCKMIVRLLQKQVATFIYMLHPQL